MAMLYFIFFLFGAAVVAAWTIPNSKVSNHKRDHLD